MRTNDRIHWLKTGLMLVVVVLTAAVACGAAPAKGKGKAGKAGTPLNPTTYDPRLSLAPLVEKVAPAVVNIRTTAKARRMPGHFDLFEWFFGPRGPGGRPTPRPERPMQHSLGSGFIIDKTGLVVTNHHVVGTADEIEVQLADDRKFKATLVGSDERTDVALLRLENAKGLPTVPLGDSDSLRVGDHVVAIGNPFGLDHTVTSGIVSAKERVIGAGPYDDFIQTDASINPGNSGGPLFNLKGEVVGINTAIAPQGQGIGFAIPSNMAQSIIDALGETGKVVRGWLGIGFQELTDKLSKVFGTKKNEGVITTNVIPESPAAKGGMEKGDVIVAINGKKLREGRQLRALVAKLKPGSTASIKVIRDGKPRTLKIKIGEMPEELGGATSAQPPAQKEKTELGFDVQDLDARSKQRLRAEDVDGVLVTRVNSASPAAGVLRAGDIIAEVNRDKVRNVGEFKNKTKDAKSGDDLLLLVYRRSGWSYLVFRLK